MKIDLVYLWCDGADMVWRKKRESYLPEVEKRDAQTFCEGRIFNNDELRYSLRSVEMYAPWINHIYIVTDNQCPEWLDTTNDKITVVDHKDIFSADVLPLYSSRAIELNIHKIEGLSEHYLYANDDMMFARSVTPDFFFTNSGKVKARFMRSKWSSAQQLVGNTYGYTIMRVNETIVSDYNMPNIINWFPHHNIDAYKKSSVTKCLEKYHKWYDITLGHRFRMPEDMQKHIFLIYAVATGDAEAKLLRNNRSLLGIIEMILIFFRLKKGLDAKWFSLNNPYIEYELKLFRPYLFCFNDSEKTTNNDRLRINNLMPKLFPKKSKFEL